MPVDDADIDAKLNALRTKARALNIQRTRIYELIERFEIIQKDDQGNVKPDPGTKGTMAPARRQEVYDSAVTEFGTIP